MKRKTHLRKIDDLSASFDALLSLEDGWLDGNGVAPDNTELVFVARKMAAHYLKRLPVPAIVPTPEGILSFQLFSLSVFQHVFADQQSRLEAVLRFSQRRNPAARGITREVICSCSGCLHAPREA